MGLRIDFKDWLENQVETVTDNLAAENSPERLQMLKKAPSTEIPDVRAGWLMGYADALQTILESAPAGLLLRKIDIPRPPGL
jgi:hypothetical protein